MCLIAPVFAFSASLVPSRRLSPWTHWTVLSLSHGSSPFSSLLPPPGSLYLSQGLLKTCVSAYVWVFMFENEEVNS